MKHLALHNLRLLAVGIVGLVATASVHAEGTLVAQCSGDKGANFFLSQVTPADASLVYGLTATPTEDNAVLVVDGDGKAHWSTASRSAIDKQCGGDGATEISLFAPIQPRNGTWHMAMLNHRMLGCSPRIASAAKAAVAKRLGQDTSHEFTFKQPFHPHPLLAGDKDATWAQTGLNHWQSQLIHEGSGAMTMDVMVNAEVISPTQINETSTFTIHMPPQLVKIMGGTGNCRSIADFKLTWMP